MLNVWNFNLSQNLAFIGLIMVTELHEMTNLLIRAHDAYVCVRIGLSIAKSLYTLVLNSSELKDDQLRKQSISDVFIWLYCVVAWIA